MSQKCILVITDGVGFNPSEKFNAFFSAKKPNYERLFKEVPNSLLKTSGLAVGLPEGQMGNSEVGHMCIGSGRIIYQNLVKINKAIEDGSLSKNKNLNTLLEKCKNIHVIGLYSDGGVHSLNTHFNTLLKLCKQRGKNVFAHAITDGRDVGPKTGLKFIKELEESCQKNDICFATLCGRFYAMDRDKRWDRVEKYYKCLMGEVDEVSNFSAYMQESYEKGITDEFIEGVKSANFKGINEEDGLIFVNFRNDRMKELIYVLNSKDFNEFKRDKIFNNLLTMSVYDDKFNLPVLFEKEVLNDTLAQVIARANLTQLHTAETEKYAHVTFFFNGGIEESVENESRVLIPSPKVKTYDERPEMSAFEVLDEVKKGINQGKDFIVVNFANGDMVGHTGSFEASVKAVEAVDFCLGELVKEARKKDYAFIITSDHGNCEAMQDEKGNILTNHTTFDVFVFVEAQGVSKIKENMGLSNIAASVLKILGLQKPSAMNEAMF
ncbi:MULTISPECIES: 2,3-bisphosphoglycerate-independent phosphoglycerate mutase [unclassified Campylobacter]|uniref:2,3-bisphosphoglycerate-independent phosphoglycerate mutase n=1 Tax=unclassified Campylobacter TaxID=2593542 RepID=UPI00123816C2|nr:MULTISPECIES: 2,3-bisphosphoglycerate-independent phosphoglycerate mutase [unclassified Campylobacter]KAA6225505.1 2,3-bisphosphoglycerate-independent phosphoglycerate mutase [Campylobacter sp. LR196d]KAA6226942.1 2,3-bisphosphoglycerate-independent phosphoglycerate mutase [Campylobacter sp. LR185c]KAA6229776.1 2,3-bisphosphoglycerate-independent phosphoglycerate mutase [Campylobacter sp. LR286c]KAA6234301.1 2,3-bisphosphoglycerate-independent phosphoglycerate mutase [Campylobacter sp. LR291